MLCIIVGLIVEEIIGNFILFFLVGFDIIVSIMIFMMYNFVINLECWDWFIEEIDFVLGIVSMFKI